MTPSRLNRRSLYHTVFAATFSLAFVMTVVVTAVSVVLMHFSTLADAEREVAREASLVASALNGTNDDMSYLSSLSIADTRFTLIEPDGTVVYDNEADARALENHADRPEVREALETGSGSSQRSSSTLDRVMLYQATRLSNGDVIRLAQEHEGFLAIIGRFLAPMLALALAVAIVSLVVARRLSKSVIEPLRAVDLDHPIAHLENAYEEMDPMLDRLESQRQELKRQVKVLSDNDRMRREFTANVTHELKTPLTTISGYAELISTGLVREEDIVSFAGKIHDEAGRMTSLVNDILTLSNLDEAEKSDGAASALGSREPIELSQVLDNVCQRLEPAAERAQVSIAMDARQAQVFGVPRLIDELVYNLTSNAIRYNRVDGTVTLSSGVDGEGKPYVSVADTGIGIAPEDQDKVFERFYRVDKSRSRARGGTGLGLAIVKHAALFHNAVIDVDSDLGKGTRITVTFPAAELPA